MMGKCMMEMIELSFFMPMERVPRTTAQQARVINGPRGLIKFDNPRLHIARSLLAFGLEPNAPKEPFAGPIELFTEWRFDYKKGHKDGEYKVSRPDTDNLNKMLKDLMTRLGFWEDDNQVVYEHIKKVWDKTDPGIWIRIRALEKTEETRFGEAVNE